MNKERILKKCRKLNDKKSKLDIKLTKYYTMLAKCRLDEGEVVK